MNRRINWNLSIHLSTVSHYHSKLPSIKAIKKQVKLNRKSLSNSLEKTLIFHVRGIKESGVRITNDDVQHSFYPSTIRSTKNKTFKKAKKIPSLKSTQESIRANRGRNGSELCSRPMTIFKVNPSPFVKSSWEIENDITKKSPTLRR